MPPKEYYLPQRTLVSQDDAAIVQDANVPRSRFKGSWSRVTAFNAGELVPFLCEEILPGDHMRYRVTAYVRMSTPLFPMFSNQRVDTFFFFVPNRLVWANWARFMGEQSTPSESIVLTIPITQSPAGGYAVGSIFDHFGIPTIGQINPALQISHNCLPLRGYNLIFNQWFRDQNSISSLVVSTGDAASPYTDFLLRRRAKSHDYFTSALPWPQKFTAPNIPLAGLAPITGIGFAGATVAAGPLAVSETGPTAANYANYVNTGNATGSYFYSSAGGDPLIYANLAAATGVSISQLRQAWMVQQLTERDARGGTRYVELIRSHFGVTNPDFRLQRPEYIGGGQTPLNLTPVAQTAPTAGVPVGALGAAGTAAGQHTASYAATEHGYIIGLINVRSELLYQQGLHRMWSRSTRYDFYWPALAQLGEQAVLRKEIYITGDPAANDDVVFGYQERWHEYRTHVSEVTGIMRSTATGTLDAWHLGQNFTAAPTLGGTFLADTPPMARVLAAGALSVNQEYLADIMIQRDAVRPIPTFGTPATLGRF